MPFLAPALPFIGKALPFVGGMLGGAFGGGKPKRDPTEQGILDRQLGLSDLALNSLTGAKDYWANILKGGPDAMMALGPEMRQINQGFDNQNKAMANFGPMGGGRSNLMAQMPYQRQAAISDVFSRARPAAAGGLANVASSANSGVSSLQQMMQNEMLRQQQGAQRGGQMGSGIFNILKESGVGGWLGGLGKGGGGGGGGQVDFFNLGG